MVMRGFSAPTFTPAQFRDLVYDATVRAPICNAMVGGHAFGSPLPQLSDDAGTPFAVVVIPVDDSLAVRLPSAH